MTLTQTEKFERVDELVAKNGTTQQPMVGQDGNAFSLMGNFQKYARKAGWSSEDVDEVIEIAKSGNYDQLLGVILSTSSEG